MPVRARPRPALRVVGRRRRWSDNFVARPGKAAGIVGAPIRRAGSAAARGGARSPRRCPAPPRWRTRAARCPTPPGRSSSSAAGTARALIAPTRGRGRGAASPAASRPRRPARRAPTQCGSGVARRCRKAPRSASDKIVARVLCADLLVGTRGGPDLHHRVRPGWSLACTSGQRGIPPRAGACVPTASR